MSSSDSITTQQNDRNLKASVCKSTPNGLNKLSDEISSCTTTTELNRNSNFAENVIKLEQDITTLSGITMDSLTMGDSMFGQFGYGDISKEVKERNNELKKKKAHLIQEVDKGESIIERTNRDFSDVKDTIPEPQKKKTLRFIEDYTLAILCISYLFMVISIIYIFTITSEFKLIAFGKSAVFSILISSFLFMVLYFMS